MNAISGNKNHQAPPMGSIEETLLRVRGKGGDDGSESESESDTASRWKQVVVEWKKVFKIAGPMMLNYVFNVAMTSANQMFAGHLSSLELSAVALVTSVVGNLSSVILGGLVSAQETLCGQAFGAGQAGLLGIYLQRSWIIVISAAFILSPMYIFAGSILNLLGQNEKIVALSGKFAIRIIPQLFGLALSYPMQKFLQTQRKTIILASVGLLALVVHVGLLWIFIYGFGWGFDGLAAAYNISAWVAALAQLTYILRWRKDTWLGLSSSAFSDIGSYLRLSLNSAIPMCIASFLQVILMLFIGRLHNAVLAISSFSICMNITEWLTMLVSGMNVAASVRVSNELGSGQPQAARYTIVIISFTSITIGAICSVTVAAFPYQIAALFTNDIELQKTMADNAYLLAVVMMATSLQTPLAGVAVGAGLQVLYGYVSFGSSLIGIPVGLLWTYFIGGGLKPIWVGLASGMVFQLLVTSLLLWKRDWKEEVARALRRVQAYAGSPATRKPVRSYST